MVFQALSNSTSRYFKSSSTVCGRFSQKITQCKTNIRTKRKFWFPKASSPSIVWKLLEDPPSYFFEVNLRRNLFFRNEPRSHSNDVHGSSVHQSNCQTSYFIQYFTNGGTFNTNYLIIRVNLHDLGRNSGPMLRQFPQITLFRLPCEIKPIYTVANCYF